VAGLHLANEQRIAKAFEVAVADDCPQGENGLRAALDRFADDEIPVPDDSPAAGLRAFCPAWRPELTA
jgi:hypothetical protein